MRILLVIALLLVGGCRKSADKAAVDTPEGTVQVDGDKVTVRTKDGQSSIETSGGKTVIKSAGEGKEGTVVVGENKAPEGFPLPVMSGARIEHSTHIAKADSPEVYQLSMKIAAPIAAVTEFYAKAFKDKGLKVEQSQTTGEESSQAIVAGEGTKIEASVVVVKEAKAKETTVAIYWSIRK